MSGGLVAVGLGIGVFVVLIILLLLLFGYAAMDSMTRPRAKLLVDPDPRDILANAVADVVEVRLRNFPQVENVPVREAVVYAVEVMYENVKLAVLAEVKKSLYRG